MINSIPIIPYKFGTWLYLSRANKTTPVTVSPLYVEYAKPTGSVCIAFAIQNIVIHINRIHKSEGVNFENPSETFARLFEAMPQDIPIIKKR